MRQARRAVAGLEDDVALAFAFLYPRQELARLLEGPSAGGKRFCVQRKAESHRKTLSVWKDKES